MIQIIPHRGPERSVGDLTVWLDLGDTGLEGGGSGMKVLIAGEHALCRMTVLAYFRVARGAELTRRIPAKIPAANPALALVSA